MSTISGDVSDIISDSPLDTQAWIIDASQAGQRVDKVLAAYLPNSSLRTRRRLCESGFVLLNDALVAAAVKVQTGQRLSVQSLTGQRLEQESGMEGSLGSGLEIIYQDTDFAVVFKPAGVHTVALAGKATFSLEHAIRDALTSTCSAIILLNRLDYETCGLVVVALSTEAVERWRKAESRGKILKTYIALVEGLWPEPYTVCRALDTDNRRISRARNHDTSDQRRHTDVTPLEVFPAGACPYLDAAYPYPTSLVQCTIKQGARHQIRAHLAAAGHPLVYDTLYGASLASENIAGNVTGFILKNTHIHTPFFELTHSTDEKS